MLASLLGMFPALEVNLVSQTLQACNYIVKEASNFCFCLGILSDDVTLALSGHTRGFCCIPDMACRPVCRLCPEAVTKVCLWLGNATLADAVGTHLQQQRCLRCCC